MQTAASLLCGFGGQGGVPVDDIREHRSEKVLWDENSMKNFGEHTLPWETRPFQQGPWASEHQSAFRAPRPAS